MPYAKLFSSITESSLWSETKDVRLLFVSMLARADATGFVEAAQPGLARLSNLSDAETSAALAVLESPDPHSKNPQNEGRRILKVEGGWCIINYEIYRERRSEEERRAYMRDYMRSYRKQSVNNRKQNVNSVSHGKPPLAQAEAEAEAEAELREKDAPRPIRPKFSKPTREDLNLQAGKIGLPSSEVDKFVNFYESNGWKVGRNPMRSWIHALTNWKVRWEERRQTERANGKPQPTTFAQAQARQLAEMEARATKAINYDPSRPL